MKLLHLSLTNFKNIREASLDFSDGVNCFLGDNGMGKSNLLDAVYMLSFCKSFTGAPDPMVITSGADIAMARGDYMRGGTPETITLGLARGRRKSLKRMGKEYQRLSQHIGLLPLVMVSPRDSDLINNSGEERRRWMDMVISQSNPRYLDALIRYNQALEQRNRMLRDGATDVNLYAAIELPLAAAAAYIHGERVAWVERLRPVFSHYYQAVAGEAEEVTIGYVSTLSAPGVTLESLLDGARRHDEIVKHTSVGPHRDDIDFQLGGMPLRRVGSQGQCKTFTIALRLAQHDFLHTSAGVMPLLLLDDIFDKLDATRVDRIMNLVSGGRFGQIFITDTNRKHLDEIVALNTGADHRLWSVADGCFSVIEE